MDRNLALEVVRVTEAAALASARLMGRGDLEGADRAAVEAMRRSFNDLAIDGEVVIGEGERDKAPMLYIGERVGRCGEGAAAVEIAVDPLEGTALCASGLPNAISVVAMAYLRYNPCRRHASNQFSGAGVWAVASGCARSYIVIRLLLGDRQHRRDVSTLADRGSKRSQLKV